MWCNYWLSILLSALVLGAVTVPRTAEAQSRQVTINRVALNDAEIAGLERQFHIRILDGHYWYDRRAGLWGFWGGPAMGLAVPGLNVGGPLTRDASRGRTGVIVNGRELNQQDVADLSTIMVVQQGRYWMEASGWGGYEGWPAMWNVWDLANQAQARGVRGDSWVHRGLGGGMSAGGGCIGLISGSTSAMSGCD